MTTSKELIHRIQNAAKNLTTRMPHAMNVVTAQNLLELAAEFLETPAPAIKPPAKVPGFLKTKNKGPKPTALSALEMQVRDLQAQVSKLAASQEERDNEID
jgi:hypothetical protein